VRGETGNDKGKEKEEKAPRWRVPHTGPGVMHNAQARDLASSEVAD